MKSIYLLLLNLLLLILPKFIWAQISIANTAPVVENFDAMGSTATASLPTNWKMSAAATVSPFWNDANNFTATNIAASSGTPAGTGGRYNWGKTGDTDRAIGFISSQSYLSQNSIMAWYKNTGADNINSLTISYDLFQFRINTSLPVVSFYYSTDGSTWTHVISGDALAIPIGASLYNFSTPSNFGRSITAGTSSFTIKGLTISPTQNVYLRWDFKTVGSSTSEGLGLDNVQLTANFGSILTQNGITTSTALKETFDGIGLSASAPLPSNWKMSPASALNPSWNDPTNFTTTMFAAGSGSPITGGRYNWAQTGDTDRAIGFISSQSYLSQNSIMAWYTNAGTENINVLDVSYDLYQFRINAAVPTVNFYYSTDGFTWTPFSAGDAQSITTGASAYSFSGPANFGKSLAAGTSAFTITGLDVPPGENIFLRWNFKTVGSSESEGLGLDNVEIKGGTVTAITRGPYMNLATQTGITIRWRTNVVTDSRVRFGFTPENLSDSISDFAVTKEHVIQLSGLIPNTKYYYSIGSSVGIMQSDAYNYFKTLPPQGTNQKVRILVMGDMGTNSGTQRNVRDAYLNYNGTNYTDLWLLLGDNSYENGLDAEYQSNFFNIYQGSLTKNHVLWPTPGNHDYANNTTLSETTQVPYYSIFSLPANGEAGGVPSGTKRYYSYNNANIHFVALDSYADEKSNSALFDTTSPQALWLKQDLAANTQKWTVVYFHHPPYSKGGSNSDTDPIDFRLRNKIVPILEQYKVDLVLTGHSHDYERTFLINGHYGLSETFDTTTMALNSSSGRYDDSPNSSPYIKNSTAGRNGIVYVLTGSAGQVGGTSPGYPHHAMQYSNVSNGGCMVIEVDDNRLDAKWICSDGAIRDNFTMMKEVNTTTDTTVDLGSSITLTASWIGNYIWSNGATTRSITLSPSSNGIYTVSDDLGYLKDSFNLNVTLVASVTSGTITCNGGTTTITVSANGGATPYSGTGSYTVGAGTHDYIVTDSVGNTATTSVTIAEPNAIIVDATTAHIDASCHGTPAGSIALGTVSGGTVPYSYTWTKDGDEEFNASTANFTGITAGTYNYSVTDSNNCAAATGSVVVSEPSVITVGLSSHVDVNCHGTPTGSIILGTITGGTAPYSYAWTKDGDEGFSASTANLNGLTAGTYNYRVTDANNCDAATGNVVVDEPSVSSITATSGVNGTITPEGTTIVNCEGSQTYTIIPASCYHIADVLVDGVSKLDEISGGTYTFDNVTVGHTISASFAINTYSLSVTQTTNGTITPGTITVSCGSDQTFNIEADPCYHIADVTVDGESVGAISSYTFNNVTANHIITATYAINTNTITVAQTSNGAITPETTTIDCGSNQTFSFVATACYHITDVIVDGSSVGAVSSYTFNNVTANHTITGIYAINTNTITVAQTSNGTISPGSTAVGCGSNQTFNIAAAACYHITNVIVDGSSVGAVSSYTFTNVTSPHTITATYAINTNTITVTQASNGSITPGTTTVNCGSNQTFNIAAASCYHVANVTVDGTSVGAVSSYTFTNVTSDHTITATYAINTYAITASSGANGTITPGGVVPINCGGSQTYTITPASCYQVSGILVDGISIGVATSYTFSNVTATHTISATFTKVVTNAGTLSGPTSVCARSTINLSSTIGGGSWSSSNISVASVVASTGVVTGVAAGTATMTYIVTGACGTSSSTKSITVNSGGTITGSSSICVGSAVTLSSSVGGGTWSSSNTGIATVNASSGKVSGISAGIANIIYTITGNGCTTAYPFTVKGFFVNAGTVNGSTPLCIGATATYNNTGGTAGGSWSSTNTSVATVASSTGLVTALAAGTTNITYTVMGCFGSVSSFKTLTVKPNVSAGTINGATSLCIGATTTYTSTGGTAGGNWTSSNTSVATVNATSGVVTGVSAGSAIITYTVTGCGSASVSKQITVTNCTPAITCPASITGNLVAGCSKSIVIPNPSISNTTTLTWVMAGATSGNSVATGINYIGTKIFNKGVTTITYTASNFGINTKCQFTVTVIDNIIPTITCPANISQSVSFSCSKSITVPNPTISDNCGVTTLTWTMSGATTASSLSTGINYISTKTFNVGITTIVYTAKDAANNASTCSFKVTVTNIFCQNSPSLARSSLITQNENKTPEIAEMDGDMTIKALPNPTSDKFALLIKSGNKENVEIVVTDIYGRKVFQTRGGVDQKYTFGSNLIAGVYVVKVLQGKNIQTLKLVKEN